METCTAKRKPECRVGGSSPHKPRRTRRIANDGKDDRETEEEEEEEEAEEEKWRFSKAIVNQGKLIANQLRSPCTVLAFLPHNPPKR